MSNRIKKRLIYLLEHHCSLDSKFSRMEMGGEYCQRAERSDGGDKDSMTGFILLDYIRGGRPSKLAPLEFKPFTNQLMGRNEELRWALRKLLYKIQSVYGRWDGSSTSGIQGVAW